MAPTCTAMKTDAATRPDEPMCSEDADSSMPSAPGDERAGARGPASSAPGDAEAPLIEQPSREQRQHQQQQ